MRQIDDDCAQWLSIFEKEDDAKIILSILFQTPTNHQDLKKRTLRVDFLLGDAITCFASQNPKKSHNSSSKPPISQCKDKACKNFNQFQM